MVLKEKNDDNLSREVKFLPLNCGFKFCVFKHHVTAPS